MGDKTVGQDGLHQPVDVVVVGMGHVHGKIPGEALGVKERRGQPPHVVVAFRDQKIGMAQLIKTPRGPQARWARPDYQHLASVCFNVSRS